MGHLETLRLFGLFQWADAKLNPHLPCNSQLSLNGCWNHDHVLSSKSSVYGCLRNVMWCQHFTKSEKHTTIKLGFMFLFCLVFAMFCARLFVCALWSPAGKGLTSWLSFVVSSVSLSLSHWYPGSGVVLDCIDS